MALARRGNTPMPKACQPWGWVLDGCPVAQIRVHAAEAEPLLCNFFEPTKIDTFATARADHAVCLVARQLRGIDGYSNALRTEQLIVGEFAVREHLLMTLVFDFRMELAGEIA